MYIYLNINYLKKKQQQLNIQALLLTDQNIIKY